MQFQVPQFIDIAPKIVGPLTLKQFLFLAGAAVPSFILFFVLQFWFWLILVVPLGGAALALAFYKFNGQPLTRVLLAAFSFFWQPRFYLWRRIEEEMKLPELPRLPQEEKSLKNLLFKLSTTTHPIAKRERPARLFRAPGASLERFESFRKTTGERETARRVDYR